MHSSSYAADLVSPEPDKSQQNLPDNYALAYVERVKRTFHDHSEIYNEFLAIIQDYKIRSLDHKQIINRLITLFKDHPDLIEDLTPYLDKHFKIEVRPDNIGYHCVERSSCSSSTTESFSSTSSSPVVFTEVNKSMMTVRSAETCSSNSASSKSTVKSEKNDSLNNDEKPKIMRTYGHSSKVHLHSTSSVKLNENSCKQEVGSNELAEIQQSIPNDSPPNHDSAKEFMAKVKKRFESETDKYDKFLDLLSKFNCYDKKNVNGQKGMLEKNLVLDVSNIFKNDDDILLEFKKFLPSTLIDEDKKSVNSCGRKNTTSDSLNLSNNLTKPSNPMKTNASGRPRALELPQSSSTVVSGSSHVPQNGAQVKMKPSLTVVSPIIGNVSPIIATSQTSSLLPTPFRVRNSPTGRSKKNKLCPFTINPKLNDFFDTAVELLADRTAYNNVYRYVTLYYNNQLTEGELKGLLKRYFSSATEFVNHVKSIIRKPTASSNSLGERNIVHSALPPSKFLTNEVQPRVDNASIHEDLVLPFDVSKCKNFGTSYLRLPVDYKPSVCSGQTALCKEVLNNEYRLDPGLSNSSYPAVKKTYHEMQMSRIEDERFELDLVIETNASTISALESVLKKLETMEPIEAYEYKLNECLGGSSAVIHKKSIERIYGKVAPEILKGLQNCPFRSIPVVLKSLKMKHEEWRRAQKEFNKYWRDLTEKSYTSIRKKMKLDHESNDNLVEKKSADICKEKTFKGSGTVNKIVAENQSAEYRKAKQESAARKILIASVKGLTDPSDKQNMKRLLKDYNQYSYQGKDECNLVTNGVPSNKNANSKFLISNGASNVVDNEGCKSCVNAKENCVYNSKKK